MRPLEVENLTKMYGDVVGVDSITFEVESGEIFGFLGPNGAGKTTAIRAFMGLLKPTSGTARVLGSDVRDAGAFVEAKRRIGYLPGRPSFDERATGREILDLHAEIKGDERSGELLELFEPPLERAVREYSTGNKQKLLLLQGFMHDPDLVFMDEPTAGLDPLMQRRFESFVRRERDRGTTVFMSSHFLGEVRRVCDRVGILQNGRLVTTEPIEELVHRGGKSVHIRVNGTVDEDQFEMEGVEDLTIQEFEGDDATEVSLMYTGKIDALIERLGRLEIVDLVVEEAPLDDIFIKFYGADSEGEDDGV